VWKEISFNPDYRVSDSGQVFNNRLCHRLSTKGGRVHIQGNNYSVARLVWEHFACPIPPGYEVRHLVGNSNHIDNLYLMPIHSGNKRKVIAHGVVYPSITAAAQEFKISTRQVTRMCNSNKYNWIKWG
jgi:hypothetical protein